MLMYIKMAWRNILRNKRRTFIAGIAIGIGLASLIFTDALVIGMERNMIHSATASFLGEGQIHREDFRDTFEVEKTINGIESLAQQLSTDSLVEHYTMRTMAFAMITSPANVSSVSLVGVEPSTEKHLSQIDEALVEGTYFTADNQRDILIGGKLAEILEVAIGDRVVLTASQAHTGDLAQEMFRISGIYRTNISEMDRAMVFIRLARAQSMLNLAGQAHEIALKFTHDRYARDRELPFWKNHSAGGNEAIGWPILLPQLHAAFELSRFSVLLVGLILFSVVALGIVNTLFMSLYERMYEFGVIRAVGTRPLAVGRLVVFEAGALALVSILLGMLLGFATTYITACYGIDYTGIEFAGVTFRYLLYPVLETTQFIYYPFSVLVFTMLVSLYPAAYAARLTPAEAMRRSL
jgi:ABC-type lipoprotein release transport system permease subunit